MMRILAALCLFTSIFCGLCGCASNLKPSSRQVDDFIQRREFVITSIDDITDPMPGTSYYPGLSQMIAAKSREDAKLSLLNPSIKAGIHKSVLQHGGFAFAGNTPLDFDVELSDELMKSAGEIPNKLNHYYARKLEATGWYVAGSRTGGTSPECIEAAYIWSDKGIKSGDTITMSDQYSVPRGYLNITISVRLDVDKNRAHVSIYPPVGVIGVPSF